MRVPVTATGSAILGPVEGSNGSAEKTDAPHVCSSTWHFSSPQRSATALSSQRVLRKVNFQGLSDCKSGSPFLLPGGRPLTSAGRFSPLGPPGILLNLFADPVAVRVFYPSLGVPIRADGSDPIYGIYQGMADRIDRRTVLRPLHEERRPSHWIIMKAFGGRSSPKKIQAEATPPGRRRGGAIHAPRLGLDRPLSRDRRRCGQAPRYIVHPRWRGSRVRPRWRCDLRCAVPLRHRIRSHAVRLQLWSSTARTSSGMTQPHMAECHQRAGWNIPSVLSTCRRVEAATIILACQPSRAFTELCCCRRAAIESSQAGRAAAVSADACPAPSRYQQQRPLEVFRFTRRLTASCGTFLMLLNGDGSARHSRYGASSF